MLGAAFAGWQCAEAGGMNFAVCIMQAVVQCAVCYVICYKIGSV